MKEEKIGTLEIHYLNDVKELVGILMSAGYSVRIRKKIRYGRLDSDVFYCDISKLVEENTTSGTAPRGKNNDYYREEEIWQI